MMSPQQIVISQANDDAVVTNHLDALLDADYLNKIDKIICALEEKAKTELVQLGYDGDLRSTDAEAHLAGFQADENERDERKTRKREKVTTKFLTLQNISWIRDSIQAGRLLPAILYSLEAGLTFMVADYVPGMKARTNGQRAGAINSSCSSHFYQQLVKRDDELKSDPKGKSKIWRAEKIAKELAAGKIALLLASQKDRRPTPSAIKRGLEKAKKLAG